MDELNCLIGLVRCEPLPEAAEQVLARIQRELFEVGAEVASREPDAAAGQRIHSAHLRRLEADIDRFAKDLPAPNRFVLPGGTRAAALLQVARAVCRRCERRVVNLSRQPGERVSGDLLAYLNRLGDLLFVLARWENVTAGKPEQFWDGGL